MLLIHGIGAYPLSQAGACHTVHRPREEAACWSNLWHKSAYFDYAVDAACGWPIETGMLMCSIWTTVATSTWGWITSFVRPLRRFLSGRWLMIMGLAVLQAAWLTTANAQADEIAAKLRADEKERLETTPAKKLFGFKPEGARLKARAIGFYSRGCLAGGEKLADTGPYWQAMRLSRNRNWGHPVLLDLIKRLAKDARYKDGWPGLLVGDLTQPRGGPMLTGHASHQIGLDADIWLKPMPQRRLSYEERERISAISMLKNRLDVNPKTFTDQTFRLIRRAASYPEVARIGVNPAIKVALCRANGSDAPWLRKVQGWRGHHYHMHIRLSCPADSRRAGCKDQPPPSNTSCAAAEKWYARTKTAMERPPPKRRKPQKKAKPRKPKPPVVLAGLPAACRGVLAAPPAGGISDVIEPPEAKPALLRETAKRGPRLLRGSR
ncbi:MAG: penicillin-insensitive murein endopeptidase [Pseudomonadota bacterium]